MLYNYGTVKFLIWNTHELKNEQMWHTENLFKKGSLSEKKKKKVYYTMPPSQAVASSSSQKGTYDLQTQLMTENVTGSL